MVNEGNEEFGGVLKINIQYFKKALKEAGQYAKAFSKGVKEAFSEQVQKSLETFKEDFIFNDKDYSKSMEYIQDKMDAVMDQINAIKYDGKDGNLKELEAEYDRLSRKLEYLKNKYDELNEELNETDEKSEKTEKSLGSIFDKSIGKIKRFTYYLLGARSVFSLFMKYRSIYYQYNEEMQYQSELSQNAIALSLAPAFELLGNVLTYASIAFAKFIELLTGVNVLSKVTTKGIRDYNKSLKETQTLVSGIDEITNLTNPQNLGLASQYQALADFQKKVKEVEEFFAKNKWIGDLAKGLQIVWKYLTEKLIPKVAEFIDSIGGAKGALILLGGATVMSAIGKLIGVAGVGASAGTGLAGVAGLLAFIAGLGIITITLKAKTEYDENQNQREEIASNYRSTYNEMIESINEILKEQSKLDKNSDKYKNNLKRINEAWHLVGRSIQSGDKEVLNNLDDAKNLAKTLDDMTNTNYYTKTFDLSEALGIQQAEDMAKTFWQKLAGWFVGQEKIDQKRKNELLDEFNSYEEKINNISLLTGSLKDKLIELTKRTYRLKINAEIVANVGKSVSSGAQALSDAVLKAIRGYASGLDYVPYDNYPALLHKGEAVVPAKYNPTIHSEGNEYTNSLLETLIIKMDDLANRPNVFEIDGQQFARTTYPLLKTESRNYTYNEGVSR